MTKEIKNIIICGLGAIGTAIGERILENTKDSLFVLVDKNRYERYIKNPRTFNNKTLNFKYITPDNTDIKADLVIIAVKEQNLDEVIENLKNFVTDTTTIISLINGITSEETLGKTFNSNQILPAYYIGSSAVRIDNQVIHGGRATIVFGAKDEFSRDRVAPIEDFFTKANINYKIPTDITRALWTKFMLNVACNQISAILGLNFHQMHTSSSFKELATNVMKEVELCAKAEGIKNTETMIEEVFEHIQTITPEGKTSMLQDIEANRETEVETFAGTVIKYGLKHNIPTPYNNALKLMIKTISEKALL